ncbi:MAG: signal recognition particle-docking protein FtsY [Gemmatimonadetes bacterium]|nr:signal recognition particle-docking protein FtsY [Gemmatimonadota bacterium]
MRLFRRDSEKQKSVWRRAVELALTDVRVAVSGVDAASLEALEEQLLAADFGVPATLRLVDRVEALARRGDVRGPDDMRAALRSELERILEPAASPSLNLARDGLSVILVVGVNGVGKTTSGAKLARWLQRQGKSVLLAAADTFRAGAIEQLRIWAERVGAEFVGAKPGGDPAAVAFDAIDAAAARGTDVVIVDTGGRLHTHGSLMQELSKVNRVIARKLDGAPHETLIVLDATIGQNAVPQVRRFRQDLQLTGIVLAKIDSTARGGIVVALQQEFGVPLKFLGTGEDVDDLEAFDPAAFVDALIDGDR